LSNKSIWLLRFSVNGHFYNFSTTPVDVVSVVDGVLRFKSGLMTEDQPIAPNAQVRVIGNTDWHLIAQQAGGITGGDAHLRRIVDDGTTQQWERALGIISFGEVKTAGYDDTELTLTISQIRRRTPIIPTTQVIDFATFAVPDDKVVGQVYPRIYGYPGFRTVGVPRPVVPALLAVSSGIPATQRFLFSGHDTEVRRNSGNVQLWRTSEPTATATATPLKGVDLLGHSYNYVTGAPVPIIAGEEAYIGFSLAEGGGIPDASASGALRGAGEVLLDLLALTDEQIDTGAMRAQFAFLNAYKLDFFINEGRSAALQAIAALVDVLPITEQRTAEGLYYQAWNWRAKRTDAVATIDAQRDGWTISGGTQEPDFTPYNRFTLEYAFDRISGGALERRILGPNLDSNDSRVAVDWRCAESRAKYGKVFDLAPVQVSTIWDSTTAHLMLMDMAAEHCLPRPVYTYLAPRNDKQMDRFRGAVVVFGDRDIHIQNRLALLWPVSYGLRTTVAVHLLPQVPTRRDRL